MAGISWQREDETTGHVASTVQARERGMMILRWPPSFTFIVSRKPVSPWDGAGQVFSPQLAISGNSPDTPEACLQSDSKFSQTGNEYRSSKTILKSKWLPFLKNSQFLDWRDSSEVKGTCCSFAVCVSGSFNRQLKQERWTLSSWIPSTANDHIPFQKLQRDRRFGRSWDWSP